MIFSFIEQIILFVLIFVSLSSFSYELIKRFIIVSKGTGSFSINQSLTRLKRVLFEFVLQTKVIKQRFWPGLMHAFVFWGFMFFSLITIDHFLIGFNNNLFSESVKHYYALFLGLPWAIFVLIGILLYRPRGMYGRVDLV